MKKILLAIGLFFSTASSAFAVPPWYVWQDGGGKWRAQLNGTMYITSPSGGICLADGTTIFTTTPFATTGQINTLQMQIYQLDTSTTAIYQALQSEITNRQAGETALGVSTGTLYSQLASTGSALTAETASRIAGDVALGLSTGTIPRDHSQITSTGTVPHSQLESRIGGLEAAFLGYALTYVPVNLASGTYVNIDSATYAPGIAASSYTYVVSSSSVVGSYQATSDDAYIRQPIIFTTTTLVGDIYVVATKSGQYYNPVYITDVSGNVLATKTNSSGWSSSNISAYLQANTTYYVKCMAPPVGTATLYVETAPVSGLYPSKADYFSNTVGHLVAFSFYINIGVKASYQSASFVDTGISTTSVTTFNGWGKVIINDNQPPGSSIAYSIKLSSDGVNWGGPISVNNGSILPYTSSYIQTNIAFSRTVSTATPVCNSFQYAVNYSSPLFYSSNNTFTGQNTFTQTPVIPASGAGYVPVGSIQAYISSSTIPSGWLYCNGQAVSTTTYSALYAAIGFTFGNPGGGNMNLPDLRGMFLRGLDNGRGLDSDANRVIGSTETDRFQGHYHEQYYYDNSLNAIGVAGMRVNIAGGNNANAAGGTGQQIPVREAKSDGTNGTPRAANETAPKNLAVVYIIKY